MYLAIGSGAGCRVASATGVARRVVGSVLRRHDVCLNAVQLLISV
jgi:hypothetical protein